jgi:uncharacterized protein
VKVVADASPLIALAKIAQFDLLQKLFGSLIITPEVYAEVVVTGTGLPGARETSKTPWIEVRQIIRQADFSAARTRFALHMGELSTLVLAREIDAGLVLIDDLDARKLAKSQASQQRRLP